MNITKQPSEVTISFSPKDYWLRRNDDNPEFQGEYLLTVRINMAYSGKPDQEGRPVLYLDEDQAKIFSEAGFGEIM